MNAHIVVVEDEPAIRRGVVDALRASGYEVTEAADGDAGLQASLCRGVSLVLLDLLLPKRDGIEVLTELRQSRPTLPVIVLTARGGEDDRVRGLRLGADDYVVKPFDLREIHARVRALTRRGTPERAGVIAFGDLVFDPAGRCLDIGGAPVPLTRREFSPLEIMLANRGRVIPKERIFDRMFSFNEDEVGINTVEIHVARLRRKLEGSRVQIRTLRGLGYQLVAEY